jgi:hypothetical protein
MIKYDYFFGQGVLKVATLNHGTIQFTFSQDVVPELSEDASEEEIAYRNQIIADNTIRAAILQAISTDETKLAEFVNLIGQDPNTAFSTFASTKL